MRKRCYVVKMLKLWHQPIELENQYLSPMIVDNSSVLAWETCRRKIYFYLDDTGFLADGRGFKTGLEAETFLLEVLCGLHSPVIGETEILGQFRQFINNNSKHAWVQQWQSRMQNWFSLIKVVREKYLYNFGSQSYGGYLRRVLQNETDVQIIGSGALVEDVLPWLVTKNVSVFARNLEKAQIQTMKQFSHFVEAGGSLSLHLLETPLPASDVLVIAAPISHDHLQKIISESAYKWKYVIDLRRDAKDFSARDVRIQNWITLEDVMEFFSQQKDLLAVRQKQALAAVDEWRVAQMDKQTVRPFGWEDLCG